MNGYGSYGSSEEHQPVTYWRGHPIYAAHVIVIVFVASMIVTSLLLFGTMGGALNTLAFTSADVLRGQVWRIVTYGLVNAPSINFAIDMLMIIWFGREVEKLLGRRKFLILFACIYLITPLLFTALGPWLSLTLAGETGAFAVFVAFATLYPNVPIFFGVLAKWAALVLFGIYTLMALAYHQVDVLVSLWATAGLAYAFVRHEQGHWSLPKPTLFKRKPKLRVLPDLAPKKNITVARPVKEDATMAEIDALLDKIATSGIASLTPKERAQLETAREGLMKRGAGR